MDKNNQYNGFPWPDDGTVRVVVFKGHQLMKAEDTSKTKVTISLEGQPTNVTSYLNVACDTVLGNVNAGNDVTCDTVKGGVNVGSHLTSDSIMGSVKAGGNIQCDSIRGNATAGGSITCDSIGGNATASIVNVG